MPLAAGAGVLPRPVAAQLLAQAGGLPEHRKAPPAPQWSGSEKPARWRCSFSISDRWRCSSWRISIS